MYRKMSFTFAFVYSPNPACTGLLQIKQLRCWCKHAGSPAELYRMSLSISHTGLLSMMWARARDIRSRILSTWGLLVACRQMNHSLLQSITREQQHVWLIIRSNEITVAHCLHLYLGNCQHSFDDLSIVSHRQDPEITAKESERRERETDFLGSESMTRQIIWILESQWPWSQNPGYISVSQTRGWNLSRVKTQCSHLSTCVES